MQPTANRSVTAVIGPLVICSGAMYVGAPTMAPEPVTSADCRRAIPKSMIFTRPSLAMRTLAGLMSRWITPRS